MTTLAVEYFRFYGCNRGVVKATNVLSATRAEGNSSLPRVQCTRTCVRNMCSVHKREAHPHYSSIHIVKLTTISVVRFVRIWSRLHQTHRQSTHSPRISPSSASGTPSARGHSAARLCMLCFWRECCCAQQAAGWRNAYILEACNQLLLCARCFCMLRATSDLCIFRASPPNARRRSSASISWTAREDAACRTRALL